MNWRQKARIMRICANVPGGPNLYRAIQKRFGRLDADYRRRFPMVLQLAQWITESQHAIAGMTFLEVGTGHLPTLPVFFSLLGAQRVFTIDLNRRLELSLLKSMLQRIAADRKELETALAPYSSAGLVHERFHLLARYQDSPIEFLENAGIVYQAPGDATRTSLPDACIDCHFSVTVLEHIPPTVLANLLRESVRLLKEEGIALHIIDLSDHSQHQDKTISPLNFLRFSSED